MASKILTMMYSKFTYRLFIIPRLKISEKLHIRLAHFEDVDRLDTHTVSGIIILVRTFTLYFNSLLR